jgi:hypothetical protein
MGLHGLLQGQLYLFAYDPLPVDEEERFGISDEACFYSEIWLETFSLDSSSVYFIFLFY